VRNCEEIAFVVFLVEVWEKLLLRTFTLGSQASVEVNTCHFRKWTRILYGIVFSILGNASFVHGKYLALSSRPGIKFVALHS